MTTAPSNPNTPASTDIGAAELQQLLADNPRTRLIDVRTGAEFSAGHIAGSHNVPLDVIADHTATLAAIEDPVVVVCRSGARAQQACASLTSGDASNVTRLSGGIDAWQAAGGTVTSTIAEGAKEPWALDRQVRLVAGSLSLAGILASVAVPKAKWLSGAVAGGLTFSAVSNTCAMGNMLAKLPYNQSPTSDIDETMAALRTGATR
jgi:rhodanese-related sulfurtransferase